MADVVRCVESFGMRSKDGSRRMVHAGTDLPADDEAVKQCPERFIPIDEWVERFTPVEQATAAPGEKRSTRRQASPKE